jgi:hypothetical protein
MMIALSVILALVSVAAAAKDGEDPLKAPRLDEDELAAIQAEFKTMWSKAVDRKQDSSSSDGDSWGGINGDKHTRRVPIFHAAANHSTAVLMPLIDKVIADGIGACKSPVAERSYCIDATRCIALHTITHYWNKLHLLDHPCQGIVNQFQGSKNKKFFNPDDKDELKDVEENIIDDILPKFGLARQKFRVICNQDFVCNQKVDCYLSAPIAAKYHNVTTLVRCPYGDFEESSISSSK